MDLPEAALDSNAVDTAGQEGEEEDDDAEESETEALLHGECGARLSAMCRSIL